jgi:hypothetical protein
MGNAQIPENYYSGQLYEFSTPESGVTPDVYTYSWTAVPALDGEFTPDNTAKVTWKAPNVDSSTDIIISVIVRDTRFPESCQYEYHITVRVKPQEGITVVKDSDPNDPQDFAFSLWAEGIPDPLNAFSLDDDEDGTLPNSMLTPNLQPGTYIISEEGQTGWDLTGIEVQGASSILYSTDGSSWHDAFAAGEDHFVKLSKASGQEVTVTFTRNK